MAMTKTKTKKHRSGPVTDALGVSGKLMDSADRVLGKAIGYNPKHPSEMSAGEINKALDKLDALDSKLTDEAIAAGMGHMRRSEIEASGSPIGKKYRELWEKRSPLRMEIERRYGPGAPSRLPKGFGPIKRNPTTCGNPGADRFLLFSQSMHTKPPNEHGTVSGPLTYVPHGTKIEVLKKGSPHRFLVHGHFGPTEFWGWANEGDIATARMYKQTHGADPEGMRTGNPYDRDAAIDGFAKQFATAGRGRGTTIQSVRARIKRWSEEVSQGIRKHEKDLAFYLDAVARYEKLYKGKGRKSNPESSAADMYESFHGTPSTEVVEVEEEEHYHGNLSALGSLIGLKIRTVTGFDWTVEFEDVLLTSNENGTHVYLSGGDQSLDLKKAKLDCNKDSVIVGEAWCIAYHTRKDFDKFTPMDYVHGFGEEKDHPKLPKSADLWDDAEPPKDRAFGTGVLPTVRYDVLNERVYLDGGTYKIEKPLVGTSPGIEG